jgi:hypothetical protein
VTVAIFVVIAHFNPEVLTGSTKIEGYFTLGNFLGMLFYGLQVAIIADIAARYRLGWRAIYLLGLVYGILEEGFAVMTMESPTSPGFSHLLRILGLNVTWTIYIMIFHATISVLASIMIIRLIWPERVSKPFLRMKHYVVSCAVLAVIYGLFIVGVTKTYLPEASALLVLAVVCIMLLGLARVEHLRPLLSQRMHSLRFYVLSTVVLVLAGYLFPFVLGNFSWAAIPLPLILLAVAILFAEFFHTIDTDSGMQRRTELYIFTILVGFWAVFPIFLRTPLSSVAAFVGFGTELALALRKLGLPNQ